MNPLEAARPSLNDQGIKHVQDIVGAVLLYGRTVDKKLLVYLNAIDTKHASGTESTNEAIDQPLNCLATYIDDGIVYRVRNTVLDAHSDDVFHNQPKGRSQAGSQIFLAEDEPVSLWNGPILTISQIIKFVTSSAAKAGLGALLITAKEIL